MLQQVLSKYKSLFLFTLYKHERKSLSRHIFSPKTSFFSSSFSLPFHKTSAHLSAEIELEKFARCRWTLNHREEVQISFIKLAKGSNVACRVENSRARKSARFRS